jgi:hypothetical protein
MKFYIGLSMLLLPFLLFFSCLISAAYNGDRDSQNVLWSLLFITLMGSYVITMFALLLHS